MDVHSLPAIDATLNGTAAILLARGYYLIRHKRIAEHKRTMILAFLVSVAFLICYLAYHAQVGSVHYRKTGPIRIVYFTILISHTMLAGSVPVLAVVTLRRAWLGKFALHKKIARWTLPI
ncbi:MAG: DUF420 domain-containing protein, partial [Bryobacteraceae bacterium]